MFDATDMRENDTYKKWIWGKLKNGSTDFLYAFIDGDRIPVPPTNMLDKKGLPKHPCSIDNRDGLTAPDYDLEELDN
jgi:hypothetical protein